MASPSTPCPQARKKGKKENNQPLSNVFPTLNWSQFRRTHAKKVIILCMAQWYKPRRSNTWIVTWCKLNTRIIPLLHIQNEGQEWTGHKKDLSAFNVHARRTFPARGDSLHPGPRNNTTVLESCQWYCSPYRHVHGKLAQCLLHRFTRKLNLLVLC